MDRKTLVFPFGTPKSRDYSINKYILGGKGAGLATIGRLGIPMPPGFIVSTSVCQFFQENGGAYPSGLEKAVEDAVRTLEQSSGHQFGDPSNPLLLSVRSGGPYSMPGMMDTILNLGLNRETLEQSNLDPRFLRDCYRRLLAMYGEVVLGAPYKVFEGILTELKEGAGITQDSLLPVDKLDELIQRSEAYLERQGTPFPQDPWDQLWGAIGAVLASWGNERAQVYRKLNHIPDDLGTAVNVQTMVFGNAGEECATGVAFTRNPSTGEKRFYGEFLVNAQGEDVVAGVRTPLGVDADEDSPGLGHFFPEADRQLRKVSDRLEIHYKDMQDMEFTIDHGKLYMLQTRTGKRTGLAAIRIAVDLVTEGIINGRTALERIQTSDIEQVLAPSFNAEERRNAVEGGALIAKGLPAGPGCAGGRIALTSEAAAIMAPKGPVVLVRAETSPDDIGGMHASSGVLTARGGMTSHAAVVARGMGKPCVVGSTGLKIDEEEGVVVHGTGTLREGDYIAIDGSTGEVMAANLTPTDSLVAQALIKGEDTADDPMIRAFLKVMRWSDQYRRLGVRTNADTPQDASVARAFGAEGIGLCRTEHMFFAEDRLSWVRQMILASDTEKRREALAHLLPVQQEDFAGIFRAMDGMPVTIRLLDPPLHEFLPQEPEAIEALAKEMNLSVGELHRLMDDLSEANPMLGHRGCRLGITYPEIYRMQVEAIARAAVAQNRSGIDVKAEIMIPLVGHASELKMLRQWTQAELDRVFEELNTTLNVKIGTMIEVPRAALTAEEIVEHADFFSFGTNDLTQMTFGFSRDDVASFLPEYLEKGILKADPFAVLDQDGVGSLVELAVHKGRMTDRNVKIGICGEHGGELNSVGFFHRTGLDYVSCSPYRVPIAKLAAAKATLAESRETH